MKALNITPTQHKKLPKAQIFCFEGDFDGAAKANLTPVESAIQSCHKDSLIIFDFSELNYLNSFALGQLVKWHEQSSVQEGRMVIVGTNDHVKDVFTVLGVDGIFKTYDDLEGAIVDLTGA